jgi:hypothetical protein
MRTPRDIPLSDGQAKSTLDVIKAPNVKVTGAARLYRAASVL